MGLVRASAAAAIAVWPGSGLACVGPFATKKTGEVVSDEWTECGCATAGDTEIDLDD